MLVLALFAHAGAFVSHRAPMSAARVQSPTARSGISMGPVMIKRKVARMIKKARNPDEKFLEADPYWDTSNIPLNTCAGSRAPRARATERSPLSLSL